MSLEKEFAQATGRAETAGLSDRQALQAVLSDERNRYLARQLCWVLMIEGVDTYIVGPRDPTNYDVLLETVRPVPNRGADTDVVIGLRGPIAPAEACNGLMIPIVAFDQIYSFDTAAFWTPYQGLKTFQRRSSVPGRKSFSTGSCRLQTMRAPRTNIGR